MIGEGERGGEKYQGDPGGRGVAVIGTEGNHNAEEDGGVKAEGLGLDGMIPDTVRGGEYGGGDEGRDVPSGKITGGNEQQQRGGGGETGVSQVGGMGRFQEGKDMPNELD